MLNQFNMTKHEHTFAKRWAIFVLKYKWQTLLLTLIIAFVIASGVQKLTFNSDYHVFFTDVNPQLRAFDELQEKYTKDNNIFIVLAPKNKNVFTKNNLLALEQLTARAWKTPYSSRVDALTNFQYTRAVDDDLYVEDLAGDIAQKSDSVIQHIKTIALHEPLLINRLINKNGSVTALNITVKIPGKTATEKKEATTYARKMVAHFLKEYPQFDVYMSGMLMMNAAFVESTKKDMTTLVPIMFVTILLTILLLTRNFYATLSTLIIMVLSIITAIGAAGHLGIKITPPSSMAPTIILTLAVADSIHIIMYMLLGLKNQHTKTEAIKQSIVTNFNPVVLTSVSTIIGFLAMNFGDVPPFWDLGNITAIGMAAALLYSLTILPVLLSVMPIKIKGNSSLKLQQSRYEKLGILISKNPYKYSILAIVVIVILGYFSQKNTYNDEFVKYFDTSIKFRNDTDFISQNLTGIYNVEFSIPSGESGGINKPGYLKNLQAFENWLQQQPEVIHVNSYVEIAKRINKSMHGDDTSFYKIPTSRVEAAQYLLLYEMSLPFGLDLNNQINVDKSETRFTITTQNLKSPDLIAFSKKAEKWLVNHTPKSMHSLSTSPTLMFSNLGFRQADEMLKGNIIAVFLITILLIIAFKSFKLGFISLIANLTPVFIGFGIWYFYNGEINTGMVIVFGMTLGIVVDDTIHFISKYLKATNELNYSSKQAVQYAFKTVGQAMEVTTIVLVLGFFILSLSSFTLNNSMAKITIIIIIAALLIDFILLPSLLLIFSTNNNSKNKKYEQS